MNYTLRDREYFALLKTVAEEFERQGISYALVGGTGVQARISDLFCRAQRAPIGDVQGLEHLLRDTKDFDITSNASEESFVRYFNELQALNKHIRVENEGIRKRKLIVSGKGEAIVYLNYQTGPQDFAGLDESFYYSCLDSAQPVSLRYNGEKASVTVATPECLIASKLTRNDSKDIWDIGSLLRTMKKYKQFSGKFRESKVRDYLENAGRGEVLGRLQEIKKQILKE